ncbi:Mks1p KNAG_0M02000 [Huiozyma naganishii CBS 8797]|uniref:Nitrogen regulatory protein areA GATA-like domain-containing protein n=1 Tax=Huiozyma naganishii (strain ATCC MYA-139 / BCRC 22969 / CBS 8797 / KCTC 17520 / NBRC 10181 / NCYC 3082 / Yp74L-3) TaxID=1071383 RepID=J7RT00_HUIN7|nr:hypothetical protein KNAG_0M02000 [Kazachstania naganishii CBS 8797]CCK73053.1 hypothetical protein KNAG_0M02000 [Kazachstania naganishii CBS 8797]
MVDQGERKDFTPSGVSSAASGRDLDKFLKVSPNLFTPERLNLFDSLHLYTSLINCSKNIEQGERLHNLSWRIVNKALLKDKNINRSKKRDGVKNLYYVLNPVNQNGNPKDQLAKRNPLQQPQTHTQQQQQHTRPTRGKPLTAPTSNVNIRDSNLTMTAADAAQQLPQGSKDNTNDREDTTIDGNDSNNSKLYKSSTALFSAVNKRFASTNPPTAANSTASSIASATTQLQQQALMKKLNKEAPKTIVTGFDPNTIITKTAVHRTAGSASRSTSNDSGRSRGAHTQPGGPTRPKVSKYRQDTKSDSLFSSSKGRTANVSNKIFFSSEDEEEDSDWNSLSTDGSDDGSDDEDTDGDGDNADDDDNLSNDYFYDDDDDQYYKRQWGKLVFSKTTRLSQSPSSVNASGSGSGSSTGAATNTSPHEVRKSLLSGLFSGERTQQSSNASTASTTPSTSHQGSVDPCSMLVNDPEFPTPLEKSTITSNVTAHGSVSSGQGRVNSALPLEEIIQRESRGRQPHRAGTAGAQSQHYSNAPLTAQTILPTALSTHMFLPNDVHHRRMAARAAAQDVAETSSTNAQPLQLPRKLSRRQSMDIPIKSRSQLLIKTRMEISEEEKYKNRRAHRNKNADLS